MMDTAKIKELRKGEYISPQQEVLLEQIYSGKKFSLFYEIRTLLYLGVLLLSTGLGILVYKNIDTIGHQAIIALLVLLIVASFYYVINHGIAYSNLEVKSPGSFYDYILLLGCLLFITLEGYLQVRYNVFGQRYSLSALIPAIAFLGIAYRFDHKGVLSLAVTGLASWIGLSVAPLSILESAGFSGDRLIYSGLFFGLILNAGALFLRYSNVKAHFMHVYFGFGFTILFAAAMAAMFSLSSWWFIVLLFISAAAIYYSKRENTFFFLLLAVVCSYIGITYILFELLPKDFSLMFYYFIFSCAGIIFFLFRYKRTIQ
jgi:hypothetical protein